MKFDKTQEIFTIYNVKVGGQPGELPTVLIGTIFYEGHKIVKDPMKGDFDREKAETLLKKQEELSEITGNPYMTDIVGLSEEAIIKYIDFVADVTDAPFLIDSAAMQVKISAVKYVVEVGLLERAVYNSISAHVKEEELAAIKENKLEAAIILAHNPRNVWPEGRIKLLKGDGEARGLLDLAMEANIKKLLIDVSVLDVPSIGLAVEAIKLVKSEFGYPSGAAPLNAVLEWKKVKNYGKIAKNACAAGSLITAQMEGADFLFYGPIKYAEVAFPACAMTDAIIAYRAIRHGIRPKVKKHPLYRIF
nr:tetrahydromethanopterin S-methyltransferase subunit H [Candidatus Baldrarchaeota archaeon]